MPALSSPTTLYCIDECADLMADACIRDEQGNLIFLSIWARDTAIQQFLAQLTLSCDEDGLDQFHLITEQGGSENADLIQEIVTTGLKLIADHPDRGDLKILNTALKELRHSLRVFAPYRDARKVTIFGSARSRLEDPTYQMAHEFAARIVRPVYSTSSTSTTVRPSMPDGRAVPLTTGCCATIDRSSR